MNTIFSEIRANFTSAGVQDGIAIFLPEHLKERSLERNIDEGDALLNLCIFLDLVTDNEAIKEIVYAYSKNNNEKKYHSSSGDMTDKIQFRDDVNDTCFVLTLYPSDKELHAVTVWSQKKDRIETGKQHSNLKQGMLTITLTSTGSLRVIDLSHFKEASEITFSVPVEDFESLKII